VVSGRRSAGGSAAGAVHGLADDGAQGVDVVLGGGVAEREAERTASPVTAARATSAPPRICMSII